MNRRRDFLQRLLDERNTIPETSRSEQVNNEREMLQQMIDEIDKEWLAYEYRPFRKYIGTITSWECLGNAIQHVSLETQQGELIFPVYGSGEQIFSFLNDSYDTVRHQRYDFGINTEVVAEIDSGGYLRSLDWLRKWDIDAPREWVITDDESFQCRCIICAEDKICEFVEIVETAPLDSESSSRFGVACSITTPRWYSELEQTQTLAAYGYPNMEAFKAVHNGEYRWELLDEMLFEQFLYRDIFYRCDTFEEAAVKVTALTGLALPRQSEKPQITL